MRAQQRITTLLKIQSGEERLVGFLVLLYFTLAMGFVFVQSMAFGVFIGEYGAQGLPYSYIAVSVFASLAAFLYIRLGERVSFATALKINLTSLAGISFLVWLGLKSPLAHSVAFTLPLLFQIVVNLGNLAIWSLAARLFDFGQVKRLFPLLGAGLWAANTIGGLLVTPLVAWLGAVNLLLLAVISIGLALLVLRVITNTYLGQITPAAPPRKTTGKAKQETGLLKDRYIRLIFVYIILWWIAFFFLDNIFYDRAAARFPDADQLTAFTGQLLSITGIVAFISSTFLTSRIISRFGLRVALVAMPLTVTLALGLLATSGSLGAGLAIVFSMGTFAKLVNVAFGFSLSQSANAIVYQSLADNLRGRVQATAEGVVQPISIGIAGLSLLALTAGLKLNYNGLAYVFLGLGAAWVVVIFLLSGNYVRALTQAITKRRLGDSPNVLAEPVCVAMLREHLYDQHPGAAIFALTRLEALDQQAMVNELPKLLKHPASEVRREALARIEDLRLRGSQSAVREQLAHETQPPVKEAALRAFGAIADDEAVSTLVEALESTDLQTQRGALVGLLKYRNEPAAEARLKQLTSSPSAEERIHAAQVLGEVSQDKLLAAHQALLRDADPGVRREALIAAGNTRQRSLVPLIIEGCDTPETSRVAGLALISIGEDVLPEIETAFSKPDTTRQSSLTLAKVLGRIGGSRTQTSLWAQMDRHDGAVRLQVLNALSQSGYHTKDLALIDAAIQAEIKQATWVCATLANLGDIDRTALLCEALEQAFTQARERVLLLLSFAFETNSILRVREAFQSGSAAQRSYALEIIDTQLPAEFKRMIMPLLEDLSAQERTQRLATFLPQEQESNADRLRTLIEGRQFTPWTRACAIYTAVQLSARTCLESIKLSANDTETLVSETARWAWDHFESNSLKGNTAMLSTIEKVIILKTVNMFSQTPDEVLADVANLLDEVDAAEGETIFNQGDIGDSMYVIVDGKVSVHDGERLLNYLGARDVFGEMALLDPEPRIASVTAVEPTRLFRLDQAPFYELIAERPEVATGIIRVLTGHIRNRVRDVAQLDARVKELERKLVAP